MRILIIGSGGREHALAWRLRQSASVIEIICPNANPGIARITRAPRLDLKSPRDWADLAKKENVDLVVVGPEGPLDEGVADLIRAHGIPVFGPGRDGARIESSKAWAKKLMLDARIPTARAESFTDAEEAKDFADLLGAPVVIKADGLAAGKGVTVAMTPEEADAAIDENLRDLRFGDSSKSVLVEEFMEGEEVSVFGLCDGKNVVALPAAQDHKRVFDNDEGPNTGGMGAYALAAVYTPEISKRVQEEIFAPLVAALRAQGIDYRGVLFAGLMLTKDGPRVVEFNCRFGDPETQVVLPLIEGDLGEILMAGANGDLGSAAIATKRAFATTIVMASGGYPGPHKTGLPVSGLEEAENQPDSMIFHAGTALANDQVITAGGRILSVTAWSPRLVDSQAHAYELCERIKFEGRHFRRDIAARALSVR